MGFLVSRVEHEVQNKSIRRGNPCLKNHHDAQQQNACLAFGISPTQDFILSKRLRPLADWLAQPF